ncbi:HNH endonuclease signature motif containing protein (plasmid) [Chromobacterium amazonense]|uniref:HNH endonuclease signature motif containing protein n=1 Tax=Chromobacterium amazonense TaxID=1382803 RepID=UPI00237E8983|nr:HNH endonuclease signature motif containing protein [Chromobacterium amazonense]MDE1714925.1 HNH endonuclease signature motif containing protein [Chromobacterium amazonense]
MAGLTAQLCAAPGCGALVRPPARRCPFHEQRQQEAAKQADLRRGSRHERGYSNAWIRASRAYRARHPFCVACQQRDGRLVTAEHVDHIQPPRYREAMESGDPARMAEAKRRFWDSSNWQSLCRPCHSRKTAREDGGFGN